MNISIEIRDNLYRGIEFFVASNQQFECSVDEYILKLIEDGFYTEKYGDLNKIFGIDEKNKDFVKKTDKIVSENVKITQEEVIETPKKENVTNKKTEKVHDEVKIETENFINEEVKEVKKRTRRKLASK